MHRHALKNDYTAGGNSSAAPAGLFSFLSSALFTFNWPYSIEVAAGFVCVVHTTRHPYV